MPSDAPVRVWKSGASDKLGPSRFSLGVWPYLWIGGRAGIRPVCGLRNGEYGRGLWIKE